MCKLHKVWCDRVQGRKWGAEVIDEEEDKGAEGSGAERPKKVKMFKGVRPKAGLVLVHIPKSGDSVLGQILDVLEAGILLRQNFYQQ